EREQEPREADEPPAGVLGDAEDREQRDQRDDGRRRNHGTVLARFFAKQRQAHAAALAASVRANARKISSSGNGSMLVPSGQAAALHSAASASHTSPRTRVNPGGGSSGSALRTRRTRSRNSPTRPSMLMRPA